jgi:hypothetical protein
MGFVDLQGNHYTQCQPEVAHPSGRSISVGTIEMKYCRLTNLDVLDSCKITILLIWQNDKSGLLKTILEVKILKMVCWTCLPYFYEWKCWNPSTRSSLFAFGIIHNYTFCCKSDQIKLCESLNYCLFGRKQNLNLAYPPPLQNKIQWNGKSGYSFIVWNNLNIFIRIPLIQSFMSLKYLCK